jgi:hypothetical protein
MEWAKQTYNAQYEKWVPWLEDKYLAWFGENKSSYVAKGTSFSHISCSVYPVIGIPCPHDFFAATFLLTPSR